MHHRFTTAIAILLLILVGLGCSLRRPKGPLTWHLILEIDAAVTDREAAAQRTVRVIERRLDAFGVYNFKVLTQGTPPNGRILVTLPDVADRGRLKKLITAGGVLELTAVTGPPSPSPLQTYSTREDAVTSLGGTVPAKRRVLPYFERDEPGTGQQSTEASDRSKKWVVVEAPAIVDGSDLRNAVAVRSGASEEDYQIAFLLGPEGAAKFGAWTGAHINDYLGVVLNGEVKSIAYIKSQISDQGVISGRFTKQSAEDLALILRSGALPAPVKIIEEGDNK
ncbi:MAG: preprotein translocase subunit SecD [Pyrinomonadaceae bacterium]